MPEYELLLAEKVRCRVGSSESQARAASIVVAVRCRVGSSEKS